MHLILPVLGALAIQGHCRSLGLFGRSNPTFLDRHLLKRTDPNFHQGDFGRTEGDKYNPDGEDKKELLKHGIKDVYELVSVALKHWDDDIFDRWFPAGKYEVQAALYGIVPLPTLFPDVGGDDLEQFNILPVDFQEGEGDDDLCAQNADAYTTNHPGETKQYSESYFCPKAFDLNQAMRLDDLDCDEDFKFDDGRYRVTNEMDSLGATILHEMMHFNTIGERTGLTDKDKNGAIISDIGGDDDNPIDDVGDPSAAYDLRQSSEADSNLCMLNADNYVWLVLELYWTHKCHHKLRHQNHRFDPPQQ